MNDVTVISAFHNRADAVDMSVGSLAAQDYPAFRAIVVDDESRDGTWDALQRWASPRIEVRRQKNRGFTATMIALCAEAETEFVALHGAGDESLPARLSAQVAFLRAHPQVVAVGCGIENVDIVSDRRWNVRPPEAIRRGPIVGAFGISHGEVMFRREAYLRAGGYRPAFTVGQASDLFRRMSRLGDFGYVEDVLSRRHLRLDGVSAKIDKVAERSVLAAISTAVHRRAIAANDANMPVLRDDLDRFGLLLPYIAPPDRGVARSLAQASTLYWAAGDTTVARRLARRSLAEAWTLRGWLARVGTLAGVGPLRAPLTAFARKLSRGKGEFSWDRLANTAKKA
ncbi:glycosyltransferase family 2 protein [Sphingomonas solaris]|nr:glycosyltransferase family A protein [Sphingomonas solaris]